MTCSRRSSIPSKFESGPYANHQPYSSVACLSPLNGILSAISSVISASISGLSDGIADVSADMSAMRKTIARSSALIPLMDSNPPYGRITSHMNLGWLRVPTGLKARLHEKIQSRI